MAYYMWNSKFQLEWRQALCSFCSACRSRYLLTSSALKDYHDFSLQQSCDLNGFLPIFSWKYVSKFVNSVIILSKLLPSLRPSD